jgi:hypothetical protein
MCAPNVTGRAPPGAPERHFSHLLRGRAALLTRVLRFTGVGDMAPTAQSKGLPTARVRSTRTIARDRESMTALWERSDYGNTWHPWIGIHLTPADDASGLRLA